MRLTARCPEKRLISPPSLGHRIESIPTNESSSGETAVTKDEAQNLADHWLAAWNAHDLDLIMAHYDDAVELTSPVAAQLLGIPDGKVIGKPSLRSYFQRGLEAYPELHFHLADVLCGLNSVVLYYTNQKGTRTAEFMELSATGKVMSSGELQQVESGWPTQAWLWLEWGISTSQDFVHSQYIQPKHPPHKKYRDDGPRDVNDPVPNRFRLPEIKHAAMVTAPHSPQAFEPAVSVPSGT
jgi:hypothetical protein